MRRTKIEAQIGLSRTSERAEDRGGGAPLDWTIRPAPKRMWEPVTVEALAWRVDERLSRNKKKSPAGQESDQQLREKRKENGKGA